MIKFLTPVTDGSVTISTSKRGLSCLLKSDSSGLSCSAYRTGTRITISDKYALSGNGIFVRNNYPNPCAYRGRGQP
jgi:hypothetical protein